jgi:cytochrome c biogenesis protein CcdA
VVIPARWEATLELVGGVALIALGAWTVGAARDVTTDAHAFQGRRPGGHRHGPGADVGGLAAIAGAVFGLSGVRGLVLLLPVALQGRVALTALAVVLFGAGVMASMLAVGSLARLVASRARRAEQALHLGVGVLSVVVGSYWVVDHLGS